MANEYVIDFIKTVVIETRVIHARTKQKAIREACIMAKDIEECEKIEVKRI